MKTILCSLFLFIQSFGIAQNIDVTLIADWNGCSIKEKSVGRMLNLYFLDENAGILEYNFKISHENLEKGFICKNCKIGNYHLEGNIAGLGYLLVDNVAVNNKKNILKVQFPCYEKNGLKGRIIFDKKRFCMIKAEIWMTKKDSHYKAEQKMPFEVIVNENQDYEMLNIPSGFYLLTSDLSFVDIQKKDDYTKKDILQIKKGAHEKVFDGKLTPYDIIMNQGQFAENAVQ